MATSTNPNPQPPPSSTFSAVFNDELEYVRNRRNSFQSREIQFVAKTEAQFVAKTEAPAKQLMRKERPESTVEEKKEVHKLQTRALEQDLCGITISGGGIRSATFGLGVLQGLAKATLLPRFDYLSTVSGGGYIGSFFSKWIHEKTFEGAESGLTGDFEGQSNGDEKKSEFLRIQARRNTGEEIGHLRQYSNYLAPTPGLFSLDGWLLISIYIRNLFLNQAVLILGAFGLVQFVRFVAEIFCLVEPTPDWPGDEIAVSFVLFAICLVVLALGQVLLMWRFRLSCERPAVGNAARKPARFWWRCSTVFSLILAFFVSLFVEFDESDASIFRDPYFWLIVVVQTVAFAVLGALCHKKNFKGTLIANILYGGVAGFIGGCIIALILKYTTSSVQFNLTFSVPAIIVLFVFSEMIYVGFAGLSLEELDREWWSSINARLLLFSFAWIVLVSIVIFSPWLFGVLWKTDWSALMAVLGGSVGTILTGLYAAKSDKTGGKKNKILEILALIAPVAFLVALFCIVSITACWISYDLFTKTQGGIHYGFLESISAGNYFSDLNSPTPNWFHLPATLTIFLSSIFLAGGSMLLANRIGVNAFSLHNLYANRLIRCYLGATTGDRQPNVLTNFDPRDDIELSSLATCKFDAKKGTKGRDCEGGPLHVINGALNRSSRGSSLELNETELARSLRNQD